MADDSHLPRGDGKPMASADDSSPAVVAGLKRLYKKKIAPVEERYRYANFHSPMLRDSDFDSKPMVLLLGQYSVGKTSFIRFMLEREFPGQRIGPEPTTDRFSAVMYGDEERVIPGNALAVQADKPFTGLNKFGTSFLSKFEAAECPAPILRKVTFIDTPGVLSGEKQRIGRAYDFVSVSEWFAERADLILLLFDAHKLDISDEFKRAIETLKGHDDKIRVVLNKADMITPQQLMRVYGALMWSLGKVFKTPEVVRVYIGSFWDQPLQNDENRKLFDAEQADLLRDLRLLPRNSAVRKVNELVKRARLAKVHAYIISHLRNQMPSMFGKKKKQDEMIANLLEEFKVVLRTKHLPPGDFPDIEKFRTELRNHDFSQFNREDARLIESMDEVLSHDIPILMQQIAPAEKKDASYNDGANPFTTEGGDWLISDADKATYDSYFERLGPVDNKVSGGAAKPALVASGLPMESLRDIWALSDIDQDGCLDADEFAVAMHLIQAAKNAPGSPLPTTLPAALVPPSKRLPF